MAHNDFCPSILMDNDYIDFAAERYAKKRF
jgi:hypothetical protein